MSRWHLLLCCCCWCWSSHQAMMMVMEDIVLPLFSIYHNYQSDYAIGYANTDDSILVRYEYPIHSNSPIHSILTLFADQLSFFQLMYSIGINLVFFFVHLSK